MSYKVEDLVLNTWTSEGKNAGHAYRGEAHFGRVWTNEWAPAWRAVCRPHPFSDTAVWSRTVIFIHEQKARAWVEDWRP